MFDAAAVGGYAYPAINVSSSETLNAALGGFADAGSDGIVPRAAVSFWACRRTRTASPARPRGRGPAGGEGDRG